MSTRLVAVISDVHFPYVHQPTWDAFRAWHKANKPDHLIMLGDMLDLAALSRFPQSIGTNQDVASEIRGFVKEANSLAKEAGQVSMIAGNHSDRWYKKIIEPIALQASGLVGLTLEEQCRFMGLEKKIKWHVESLEWRGLQVGKVIFRHGDKQTGKFGSASPARSALVRTLGRSQVFGHFHRIELCAMGTSRGTEYAVANGHMSADHSYSLENTWARGFTVFEHDVKSGFLHPYPIIIENGRFVWGRKVYSGAG